MCSCLNNDSIVSFMNEYFMGTTLENEAITQPQPARSLLKIAEQLKIIITFFSNTVYIYIYFDISKSVPGVYNCI